MPKINTQKQVDLLADGLEAYPQKARVLIGPEADWSVVYANLYYLDESKLIDGFQSNKNDGTDTIHSVDFKLTAAGVNMAQKLRGSQKTIQQIANETK